jgi:hypothetical protein
MYVEEKDGGHSGEAWIGLVSFSKTGATLYFNGRAYRSLKGRGFTANYADVETGEQFWITGVKRRGTNRHQFGSGVIHVDRRAMPMLLKVLGTSALDPARFPVGDAIDTSVRRGELHEKENAVVSAKRPDKPVT